MSKNSFTIPLFGDLIRKIKIANRKSNILNASQRIPKKIGGYLPPILPLIPEEVGSSEDEKHEYIGYEFKAKADKTNKNKDAARYKKYVRIFNEGTPQAWITLMADLDEIML